MDGKTDPGRDSRLACHCNERRSQRRPGLLLAHQRRVQGEEVERQDRIQAHASDAFGAEYDEQSRVEGHPKVKSAGFGVDRASETNGDTNTDKEDQDEAVFV